MLRLAKKAGSAVYAGGRVAKNCCFIEIIGDRFVQCIVPLRWHSLSRGQTQHYQCAQNDAQFLSRSNRFGFSEAFVQSA
jgi:hypothetical protein